jgi:pimeloyl-ACP methyl ester carboxylesterase
MTTTTCIEEYVEVAGAKVRMLRGGVGKPVLVLHSVEGNPGWLPFLDDISKNATAYAPTHPGFGHSERPDWLETVADLACFYLWMLQELGLERVSLIGHFLGGWVAAEMAVMCPHVVEKLVLVDAAGIRPREGEIADIFLLGEEETTKMSFYDRAQVPGYAELFERELSPEERELRMRNREMTTRLCWKPYMHDRSLPWLLPRVRVPTLVVWGKEDRIIPVDSGKQYSQAIPGSRLEVIERCGHLPHLEKPKEFVRLVLEHLGRGLEDS